MRAVGLKVLKNRLSEFVRLAREGETILVTDRDRVVAELVPPRAESRWAGDALLADARRKGWLRPPSIVDGDPPPRDPVTTTDALLRELDEDRGER